MRSLLLRVLAATAAAIALTAAPAAAADPDPHDDWEAFVDEYGWDVPPDLRDEALTLLFREIGLLWELDAFNSAGGMNELRRVNQAYTDWSPDRGELIDELRRVDADLARMKSQLLDHDSLPPDALTALDDNIAAGFPVPGGVDRALYTGALSVLVSEGTADQLRQIGALGAEMDQPLEQSLDRLVRGSEPTGTFPWAPVVVLAALSAVLCGGLMAWRLGRRRRRDDGASETLELTRRLTDADDEATAAAIVAGGATGLTGAERAWLLRRSPDGLRLAGETTMLIGSALDRVVDTGQPLLAVITADPLTAGRPAALAAVPVVTRGEVTGVVAVSRNADQPFDDDTRRRLELLAPVLGGTLANIDRLDTAHNMALVDGLTSLANRRRLDGDLESSLAAAIAHDLPLAFAMVDVDHFKHFNDTNGHEAGDDALRTVAHTIQATVRSSDIVYRYGGEEFSVLLPGATDDEAALAAERIRAAVETTPVAGESTQPGGRLTVSVGVSTLTAGDAEGLRNRADTALYEAKANGRNRTVIL